MADHLCTFVELVECFEHQHVLEDQQRSSKPRLLLQLLPNQMDSHAFLILS